MFASLRQNLHKVVPLRGTGSSAATLLPISCPDGAKPITKILVGILIHSNFDHAPVLFQKIKRMRKYLILSVCGMICLPCMAQNRTVSLQNDFQLFSQGAASGVNSSSLPVFNRKQETVGSQFLYKNWVKGMVTNRQGISFSNGLFNYD